MVDMNFPLIYFKANEENKIKRREKMKKILSILLVLVLAIGVMTSCEGLLAKIPGLGGEQHTCENACPDCNKCTDADCNDSACSDKCQGHKVKDEWDEQYSIITVAEVIALAEEKGEEGESNLYVRGTVKKMLNIAYGEMTLADETGEIYVYGVYGQDGTQYSLLAEKAVEGDEVLLYCTTINTYNGTPQIKRAELIDFKHVEVEVDPSEYTEMSVANARSAAAGAKVKLTGVVAAITYANGKIPSGFILVDGASTIYVYDRNAAAMVQPGNKVVVAGVKTYWILEDEQTSAAKFGYKGCNQISEVTIVSNDKGNHAWTTGEFTEITMKDLVETPVTEDITTQLYKTTALVKKVVGTGFTNYYFFDIDGETGAYTYTQCNGGDFTWLDEFDGKICTVYLTALNAKSDKSSCFFRVLPVKVIDEGYTFDLDNAAKYAVQYHGVTQFLSQYTGNPELELTSVVDSELLGFTGATLTYSSSNTSVVYFTEVDGKVVFNCGDNGIANVTITATYNGVTYSETVTVIVMPNVEYDTITIEEAVASDIGEEVLVRGIVGPSVANQDAFYLFDETGMVAIKLSKKADFANFAIGNEVVIIGKRDVKTSNNKAYGQICISEATVVANYYGNHDYNTDFFIEGKTLEYVYNLDENDMSETCNVYILTGKVTFISSAYSTQVKFTDGTTTLTVYCSGAGQYSWLADYVDQEVTVELAPCNWNSKNYFATCILSITTADGTKIYNTLNFDSAK